jgi:hypothetical protein
MLNEDLISGGTSFTSVMNLFHENNVFLSDKERYLLTSVPNVHLAVNALDAYMLRESQGFLAAVLAFSLETSEFNADFFNEYSLTLGRSSQGVTQFKNSMLTMVDKSKKIPTKPDVSQAQQEMNVPEVFSLHSRLADKAMQNCT